MLRIGAVDIDSTWEIGFNNFEVNTNKYGSCFMVASEDQGGKEEEREKGGGVARGWRDV